MRLYLLTSIHLTCLGFFPDSTESPRDPPHFPKNKSAFYRKSSLAFCFFLLQYFCLIIKKHAALSKLLLKMCSRELLVLFPVTYHTEDMSRGPISQSPFIQLQWVSFSLSFSMFCLYMISTDHTPIYIYTYIHMNTITMTYTKTYVWDIHLY